MSPVMTFRIAFKALGRNKMRTGLTMLGMIIGVSAVIALVAMGNGAQSVIEDQIKGAGTNMITVNAGNFSQGGVRGGSGTSSSLTVEDAEAIRDQVDADPVGQVIRIRNQPFKVIGVMAAKGQTGMGPDMDDQILAPYTTVMKKLLGATSIREIIVSGASAEQTTEVADAI